MRAHRTEPEDRLYTIEEYEQLPDDDERYRGDLVRGRIVREPPPGYDHGDKQLNLAVPLRQHVREHRLGRVTIGSGWALLPGVATVRGPDISFIAEARIPPEGLPHGYPPDGAGPRRRDRLTIEPGWGHSGKDKRPRV